MAQRSKGERVLGPYPIGRQWRVIVVGSGGERDSRFYPTKEKAEEIIRAVRREFTRQGQKTVQEAMSAYEEFLSSDKGNKAVSVANTMYRLGAFFPDQDMMLGDLTARSCEGYYEDLRKRTTRNKVMFSVDSHRTILAAAKTFLRWCSGKPRRWLSRSPIEEVQGVGKRRHGKPQLRIDEARKWVGKATELAGRGEAGAVAALVSLLMGMRASEITTRVARDLDDEGKLLWIPDAKTEAGKRTLQVPEVLQPYLKALAKAKSPQEKLFGEHWRDWVRKWVKRICVAARVPEVTAHGMRGLHSRLALEHGASAHVVASSLGHESFSTTVESYAKPEALAGARQRRVITVLDGGRLAS
jgi:integrase